MQSGKRALGIDARTAALSGVRCAFAQALFYTILQQSPRQIYMPTTFPKPERAPDAKGATVMTDRQSPMRKLMGEYDCESTVLGPLTGWPARPRMIVDVGLS